MAAGTIMLFWYFLFAMFSLFVVAVAVFLVKLGKRQEGGRPVYEAESLPLHDLPIQQHRVEPKGRVDEGSE